MKCLLGIDQSARTDPRQRPAMPDQSSATTKKLGQPRTQLGNHRCTPSVRLNVSSATIQFARTKSGPRPKLLGQTHAHHLFDEMPPRQFPDKGGRDQHFSDTSSATEPGDEQCSAMNSNRPLFCLITKKLNQKPIS